MRLLNSVRAKSLILSVYLKDGTSFYVYDLELCVMLSSNFTIG